MHKMSGFSGLGDHADDELQECLPEPPNANAQMRTKTDLIDHMTNEREAAMPKGWLLRACLRKLKRHHGFDKRHPFRFPAEKAFVAASLAEQIEQVSGLAVSLRRHEPVIIAISTQEPNLCHDVIRIMKMCFETKHSFEDLKQGDIRQFGIVKEQTTKLSERKLRPQSFDEFDSAVKLGGPIILLSPNMVEYFRAEICRHAAHHFDVSALSAHGFGSLLQVLFRARPSLVGFDASRITPRHFALAMREATASADVVAKLKKIAVSNGKSITAPVATIESMHGCGKAKEWASNLIDDMEAYRARTITWTDVDSKLLLAGPPGTGKTTFAHRVANTLRVPLLSGSVAQWNAEGDHLGHTLSAIRKCFSDARQKAPAVLLLDELDGISSRSQLSGNHCEYWTQLINLLLEEMDGSVANEGVIIIGATNLPEKIDPALLRSGRLDRMVMLELPDRTALDAILRGYLGPLLPDVQLDGVTKLMEVAKFSGADVEALVKRAKSDARRARRDLSLDDLFAQLPDEGAAIRDPVVRWSVAIHEAAHAVVAHVLNTGEVMSIMLHGAGGRAMVNDTSMVSPSRRDAENQLCVILAGTTAEEVLIGPENVLAGSESDLVRATGLATMMELSMGFGESGLLSMPTNVEDFARIPFVNGMVAKGVMHKLAKAKKMTAEIISANKAPILRVASHLLEHGEADGEVFRRLFAMDDEGVASLAPDTAIAMAAKGLVEAHMSQPDSGRHGKLSSALHR